MKPHTNKFLSDPFLKNSEIDFTQMDFKGKLAAKLWKLENAVESINRARIVLFILAAYFAFSSIISYFLSANMDLAVFISSAILGGIFLVSALSVKQYPVVSLVIPFVLYLVLELAASGGDPMLLLRGSIWKVLTIGLLGYGIYSAFSAKKIKQELIEAAKKSG